MRLGHSFIHSSIHSNKQIVDRFTTTQLIESKVSVLKVNAIMVPVLETCYPDIAKSNRSMTAALLCLTVECESHGRVCVCVSLFAVLVYCEPHVCVRVCVYVCMCRCCCDSLV